MSRPIPINIAALKLIPLASLISILMMGMNGGMNSFIEKYQIFDRLRDKVGMSTTIQETNFDFIIVGAGSSGSVLANRLSRKWRVLLLEAGGTPNPLTSIPALAFPMAGHAETDWLYKTVPQKNACLGLINQQSKWPRGKAEGGSSNLNAMIYLRGHPKDFNNWAEITDDPFWKYDNVKKFYKRIEDFQDQNPKHGHGGEQYVEEVKYGPLNEFFINAGREFGYKRVDLNDYHVEGFAPLTLTTKNGVRFEDYLAYLKPAKHSPLHRLSVYDYAHVEKILIDSKRRATGVIYSRHGITKRAYANKEVIISAGSINSPQLLMLSGIGPKEHLEALGIPVIQNLPIGRNLQDHVGTLIGMFSVEQPLTTEFTKDLRIENVLEYITQGTGPISNTGTHAVASLASKYEQLRAQFANSTRWPDYQLMVMAGTILWAYEYSPNFYNIRDDMVASMWKTSSLTNSFVIYIVNSRPVQRGTIKLAHNNPYVPPIIDPKYLQNRKDVDVLIDGIKTAVKLVTKSKSFELIGGKLLPLPLEPCAKLPFTSDEYWECYLRHLTFTIFHPCCTVPMGNVNYKNDYSSSQNYNPAPIPALDSKFNVIGIKNLRVIDASSFPIIPSSNLNGPANVIGEMGSYLILQKWR